MSATTTYREPFGFERVLVRAFDIVRTNLLLLAGLTVTLYGLPRIGSAMLDVITDDLSILPDGVFGFTNFVYWVLSALGAFALQAAVVYVAAADLNGRRPEIGQALRTALRFLVPLIGICLVTFIAVLAGSILFIVPGLFVATIWSMAAPVAVAERLGVGAALSRSASLTVGYRWNVFGMIAGFIAAMVLIGVVIHTIQHAFLTPVGMLLHGVPDAANTITNGLLDIVGALAGAIGVTSIYYELRVIKEGAGPEDLADLIPE